MLDEHLARARFGVTAWAPDDGSFFYNRRRTAQESAPLMDEVPESMVLRHVISTHADGAGVPPSSFGVSAAAPVGADEIPVIAWSPDSPYAIAVVRKFVKNEVSLYAAPIASLHGASTPWLESPTRPTTSPTSVSTGRASTS